MIIWAGECTLKKTTLKKGARQRENSRGENVKSGVRNQEVVFIGTKAFNAKEAGKPLLSLQITPTRVGSIHKPSDGSRTGNS